MKKTVYFAVFLFTGFALLAHVVAPYHYHAGTGICFISHCKDSNEAHRHDHNDLQTHNHDGNPLSGECSIEDAYIRTNDTKTACLHTKCDCQKSHYALIDNNLSASNLFDAAKTQFQLKPYLPSRYTDYIVQSLGLRAPPSSHTIL